MTPRKIESDRLCMRFFREDDLNALWRIMSNPEVMRFSLSGPYSREKTEAFLKACIESYASRATGLYAVELNATKEVIGYCGFYYHEIDGREEVEIGYRIHPDFWGRGIATEAAKAIQAFGKEQFGYQRLISIIEAKNTASIRVAEKCGMRFEKESIFKETVPVCIYSIG